ncbi:hypothetical protein BC831DRAFT_419850 [Entophlyctis helioformis]|nr:hypothetical protein BC831DRAFT_419850 [Entophlyctis helioformis]
MLRSVRSLSLSQASLAPRRSLLVQRLAVPAVAASASASAARTFQVRPPIHARCLSLPLPSAGMLTLSLLERLRSPRRPASRRARLHRPLLSAPLP